MNDEPRTNHRTAEPPQPGTTGAAPLVRNISDTALWVAHYRADETERPDAVFRDPLARALAGERGAQIAGAQPFSRENSWSFVARTYAFDRMIADEVRAGADLVINLAAGLDTTVPDGSSAVALRWIEMDLPGILDYKERILASATPVCRLERVRVDLADEPARRAAFRAAMDGARRVVVVTEGLLIYLQADQVVVARARPPRVQRRGIDPRHRVARAAEDAAGTRRSHGRCGRRAVRVRAGERAGLLRPARMEADGIASLLKVAGRLKRLPWKLRFFAILPDPRKLPPARPWSGVIKLARA